MSIHFQSEVSTARGAEARLIGQPARRFITWRESDERFFLSYVSAISGRGDGA